MNAREEVNNSGKKGSIREQTKVQSEKLYF